MVITDTVYRTKMVGAAGSWRLLTPVLACHYGRLFVISQKSIDSVGGLISKFWFCCQKNVSIIGGWFFFFLRSFPRWEHAETKVARGLVLAEVAGEAKKNMRQQGGQQGGQQGVLSRYNRSYTDGVWEVGWNGDWEVGWTGDGMCTRWNVTRDKT